MSFDLLAVLYNNVLMSLDSCLLQLLRYKLATRSLQLHILSRRHQKHNEDSQKKIYSDKVQFIEKLLDEAFTLSKS